MTDAATGDLKLPLVAMNPMGKEHAPALLDEWIALGADEIAAHAVADAATRLEPVPGEFQVGLVIADDAKDVAADAGAGGLRDGGSGLQGPALDADDLAYTREAIAGHLDATDQPTIIACLFGDEIASGLGYPQLGFSRHAGFALALADQPSRK